MNNHNSHDQPESEDQRQPIMQQQRKQSDTPLYNMFAKHIEPLVYSIQRNQLWIKFTNMFSFQLGLMVMVLIFSIFTTIIEGWIILLAITGVGIGLYSVATRDPLGMFIYSVLNFIGFAFCFLKIDYGYAVVGISFSLLLTNQIMSIGYILEFGREKLKKREEIVETLASINQSNV